MSARQQYAGLPTPAQLEATLASVTVAAARVLLHDSESQSGRARQRELAAAAATLTAQIASLEAEDERIVQQYAAQLAVSREQGQAAQAELSYLLTAQTAKEAELLRLSEGDDHARQ